MKHLVVFFIEKLITAKIILIFLKKNIKFARKITTIIY